MVRVTAVVVGALLAVALLVPREGSDRVLAQKRTISDDEWTAALSATAMTLADAGKVAALPATPTFELRLQMKKDDGEIELAGIRTRMILMRLPDFSAPLDLLIRTRISTDGRQARKVFLPVAMVLDDQWKTRGFLTEDGFRPLCTPAGKCELVRRLSITPERRTFKYVLWYVTGPAGRVPYLLNDQIVTQTDWGSFEVEGTHITVL